ncbi:MAG: putative RNase H-like nuclease [Patiriisocius sp.]
MAKYVGVDGCKSGWFAVWEGRSGLQSQVYPSIVDLWEEHKHATRILIDVPMGLKVSTDRLIEKQVRKLLGPRRSSVFPVPCLAAAYAKDYPAASAINRTQIGKGLSKQAWFITPKICDVDRLLIQSSRARDTLGECHPELAFATFNLAPLTYSKKTAEGQNQRQELLNLRFAEPRAFIENCLAQYPRSVLQIDDCMDALILLATARNARRLDDRLEEGCGGIPIGMWVPDIPSYY